MLLNKFDYLQKRGILIRPFQIVNYMLNADVIDEMLAKRINNAKRSGMETNV